MNTSNTADSSASPVDPFRETIHIARGPNEDGHDAMASSAQNTELAEQRQLDVVLQTIDPASGEVVAEQRVVAGQTSTEEE